MPKDVILKFLKVTPESSHQLFDAYEDAACVICTSTDWLADMFVDYLSGAKSFQKLRNCIRLEPAIGISGCMEGDYVAEIFLKEPPSSRVPACKRAQPTSISTPDDIMDDSGTFAAVPKKRRRSTRDEAPWLDLVVPMLDKYVPRNDRDGGRYFLVTTANADETLSEGQKAFVTQAYNAAAEDFLTTLRRVSEDVTNKYTTSFALAKLKTCADHAVICKQLRLPTPHVHGTHVFTRSLLQESQRSQERQVLQARGASEAGGMAGWRRTIHGSAPEVLLDSRKLPDWHRLFSVQ